LSPNFTNTIFCKTKTMTNTATAKNKTTDLEINTEVSDHNWTSPT